MIILATVGGDIRDIKGLEHFVYSWLYYLIPIIVLAALIYAAWRLLRRGRKTEIKIKGVPQLPPDEIALRELAKLRNGDFFSQSKGEKLFHFRLSEILRNYLEGRYYFQASDMTTEEILPLLSLVSEIDQEKSNAIRRLLMEFDKVKFAKYRPGQNVAFGLLSEVEEFVKNTRRVQPADNGGHK